ncbi:MAG: hypothetical protein K8S54_09120 [Spirochaetia bacterium]|nr:hypothetical protein [Spirochaetia bacterium]
MKGILDKLSEIPENNLAWGLSATAVLLFLAFAWTMAKSAPPPTAQNQVNPEIRNLLQRRVWLEARIKVCTGKKEPTPACKAEDIKNLSGYQKELADLETQMRPGGAELSRSPR